MHLVQRLACLCPVGALSWGLSLPRWGAKGSSALTQRSCHLPVSLHTVNTKERLCSPLKV